MYKYDHTDFHRIELSEEEERILKSIFECFSHIDESTKKRVIKSQ